MPDSDAQCAGTEKKTEYIELVDLEKGYLYRIDGRNASFGVYWGNGEFLVRRYKFGDVFIDSEDHFDKDRHGTVKPLLKMDQVPESVYADGNRNTDIYVEERLLAWLEEQRKRNPIEETV